MIALHVACFLPLRNFLSLVISYFRTFFSCRFGDLNSNNRFQLTQKFILICSLITFNFQVSRIVEISIYNMIFSSFSIAIKTAISFTREKNGKTFKDFFLYHLTSLISSDLKDFKTQFLKYFRKHKKYRTTKIVNWHEDDLIDMNQKWKIWLYVKEILLYFLVLKNFLFLITNFLELTENWRLCFESKSFDLWYQFDKCRTCMETLHDMRQWNRSRVMDIFIPDEHITVIEDHQA